MKLKKALLIGAGCLFVAMGAAGVLLPVLPTTPFLLLAAGCFSASSQKLHNFLLRSKYLGAYIDNYQNKCGVPLPVKVTSLIALWVMLGLSAVLIQKIWIAALLGAVGIGVTIHLLTIRTMQK